MLPLSFILPDAPREGIVVNLATMRLFQFKGNGDPLVASTYPVGVGTDARPTPTGQMYVARKTTRPTWYVPASIAADYRKKGDPLPAKMPPGPQNPLGEFALYLSKSSYLIHGTNKPASIGLKATNGCLRLYPENVKILYDNTPVKTPVLMVNQPYLLGQHNGALYLEAHTPMGDSSAIELEKIHSRLRNIEKETARTLDWVKIEKVLAEARGIPVPILEMSEGNPKEKMAEPIEIKHPDKLFGRPEIPELRIDAWYVLAADVREEIDALRMAAIISHQGPPIPARVVSIKDSYCVVAGPFNDNSEARDAVRRLKIDLGIDGVLIEVSERDADPAFKKGI
jgi:L,D-transpeptidase ErfK/SrfK